MNTSVPTAPTTTPAIAIPRPFVPRRRILRNAPIPRPTPTGPGIPPRTSRPAMLVTSEAIARPSVGGWTEAPYPKGVPAAPGVPYGGGPP